MEPVTLEDSQENAREEAAVSASSLQERAQWLRLELLEMVAKSRKGHLPSSYSATEILIALFYGKVMRHQRGNPRWSGRDRLIVSKGHAGMAAYPIYADLGYFAKEELWRFTKADGILRMYPDPSIPGVEASSGSLGHALGVASGVSLMARRDGQDFRSFVLLGDGELYEGSIWETALFAAHNRLDNLVAIVDRNGLCIMGGTEQLVKLDSVEDKWRAFGWHVVSANGHSFPSLLNAFSQIGKTDGKPLAIVAHTVEGRGISFMEHQALWHNKIPSEAQFEQMRSELSSNPVRG